MKVILHVPGTGSHDNRTSSNSVFENTTNMIVFFYGGESAHSVQCLNWGLEDWSMGFPDWLWSVPSSYPVVIRAVNPETVRRDAGLTTDLCLIWRLKNVWSYASTPRLRGLVRKAQWQLYFSLP